MAGRRTKPEGLLSRFFLKKERAKGLLTFLWIFPILCLGQTEKSIFRPDQPWMADAKDETNGLLHNQVTVISEDSRGFIWLGTEFGLSRFDGRKFRNYNAKENGLSHPHILSVTELKDHRLAIGTEQGFSLLDPVADTMEALLPGKHKGFTAGYFSNVLQDTKGRIWVYSLDGLFRFFPEKKEFRHVPNPVAHLTSGSTKPGNRLYAITESEDGLFWIGSQDGLFLFDPKTEKWTRAFLPERNEGYERFGLLVNCIQPVSSQQLFFTTYEGGLYEYRISSKTIHSLNKAVPGLAVKPGKINGKTVFWYQAGEYLFLHESDPVTFHLAGSGPVSCMFPSQNQTIWYGKPAHGIAWMNPSRQIHHAFPPEKGNNRMGTINSLLFDNQQIWTGSYYGSDIQLWDESNQTRTDFWAPPPLSRLTEAQTNVGHILKTSPDQYWFSTLSGLISYKPESKKWDLFKPEASGKETTFFRSRFIKAETDGDSGLWLLSYDHRLVHFRLKTQTFQFPDDPASQNSSPISIPQSEIRDIGRDTNGNLWVATPDAVWILSKGESEFKNVIQGKGSGFHALSFSKDGAVWVASGKNILNQKSGQKEWATYPIELIFSLAPPENIVADESGRLWASHGRGLSVFDPQSGRTQHFSYADGFPRTPIATIAAGPGNRIWYGGEEILGYLEADNIDMNPHSCQAWITSVRQFGKQVRLSPSSDGPTLEVNHDENDLEVEFSVINYRSPSETTYFYRISENDSTWKTAGDGRISFSNLAPGAYRLEVAGSTNPGSKRDSILIRVLPPFYRRTGFLILCLIVLLVVIWLVFRFRIRQITRKVEIGQEIAELKMRALRTQMNPHFLFNCFNAIQECVLNGRTKEAATYLARFAKLVRLILEHSEKVSIRLDQELDFLQTYLDMEKLRFEDPIDIHLETDRIQDLKETGISPMLIQPFVENAIWHGLRKKHGDKQLWIRFSENEDCVLIDIEDNGIGRSEAVRMKESTHQSKAMGIFEERLKLLPHQKGKAGFTITDKTDTHGTATGTLISITLPKSTPA